MKRLVKRGSLRFRMMVLFCLAVGAFLLGTYAIIYSIFSRELWLQFDSRLNEAGVPMVEDLAAHPPEEDVFRLDLPDEYLELMDASGKPLNMSANWREHPIDVGALNFPDGKPVFRTVRGASGTLRVELIPFQLVGGSVVLAIAGPTRDIDIVLANFRKVLMVLFPISLLLTGAISAWYVGRSLSPIAELTEHAARLTRLISDPTQGEMQAPRIVSNSDDELGHLATTFNELFARMIAVLQQLRQFVSDASHELRTPLSVLQGETELLLSERRRPEEYEKTLEVIHGELRHLSRIVEGLFTLSMADAGQLRVANDPLYINEVLEEACELAIPLGRAKGITIEQNLEPDVATTGDESFLRDLFLVFLENAVKYSPPNTRIRVSLRRAEGAVQVKFEDEGIGISPEHLPNIFKRFYRAAGPERVEARSGGLGLAIAQAIANAHGGRIACETSVGRGSTFTITLPIRPERDVQPQPAPRATVA
jgi:two-component system, OmpR family, sensor kinase